MLHAGLIWFGITSLTCAFAPWGVALVVARILVDTVSWRLVFAINVMPIAVTLFFLAKIDEPARTTLASRIDVLGACLAAVGLGGPVFALIEQGRPGWWSPVVFLPLIVGLLAFAAFIWWEGRMQHPMMPLDLFRIRTFGVGNLATFGIYAALSLGFFCFCPLPAAPRRVLRHGRRAGQPPGHDHWINARRRRLPAHDDHCRNPDVRRCDRLVARHPQAGF